MSRREPTIDPNTWIVGRGFEHDGTPYIVYECEGDTWIMRGACICCGECAVGSIDPNIVYTGLPIGWPMAAYDKTWGEPTRLDVPMRPTPKRKNPHCTLEGEYL